LADEGLTPVSDERLNFGSANKLVTFGFGLFREAYAMAMLGVVNAHHKRAITEMVRMQANCQRTVTNQQPCHRRLLLRAEEFRLQASIHPDSGKVLSVEIYFIHSSQTHSHGSPKNLSTRTERKIS
jgi:hypothetical protein